MEKNLFSNYADFIRDADTAMIEREMARPSRLRLDAEIIGRREVTVAYAPFDHVVPTVRVVIIGITPGRQQARNALLEARRPLRSGRNSGRAGAVRAAASERRECRADCILPRPEGARRSVGKGRP